MDVDLPVWTIRPNWAGGVLERLEWQTDVLSSDTGVEQRRALRLTPRRSFEITVNPTRTERTYLDLLLHRLGSKRWLFPLWHDQAALTADVVIGGDRIQIDNTYREFRAGDFALIFKDAMTWEVVSITDTNDFRLVLSNLVEGNWPRGTKVYPLRIARIQSDTSLAALTSRVGQSVLLFQCEGANEHPFATTYESFLFEGASLMTVAPNRVQEITTAHTRLTDEVDGEIGIVEREDSADRAFSVQSHNWQVQGRRAQTAFRSFLYYLRGRQRAVWLPTFNEDVTVAARTVIGIPRIDIDAVGMLYIGGGSPIPGRATLWSGKEVVRIGAISRAPGTDRERLATTTPLQNLYEPGATWSFLQAARLDQDSIEIHHYADSNGVFEVSAGFRTFADDRAVSGTNFLPLPISDQTDEACGAPAKKMILPRHSPNWRYLVEPFNTTGTDYSAALYDDTAWPLRSAPFYRGRPHVWKEINDWGFGAGTDTIINGDIWMRKRVNATVGKPLRLVCMYDNAARVWINNQEIVMTGDRSRSTGTYTPTKPSIQVVIRIDETQGTADGNYTFGDIEITEI